MSTETCPVGTEVDVIEKVGTYIMEQMTGSNIVDSDMKEQVGQIVLWLTETTDKDMMEAWVSVCSAVSTRRAEGGVSAEIPQHALSLELLFNAGMKGGPWDDATFVAKCCDKGPTLTLIKTNIGDVFGGYADVPWKEYMCGIASGGGAFLFDLQIRGGGQPFKINLSEGMNGNAMGRYNGTPLAFGSGWLERDEHRSYPEVSEFALVTQEERPGMPQLVSNIGRYNIYDKPTEGVLYSPDSTSRTFDVAEVEVYRVHWIQI